MSKPVTITVAAACGAFLVGVGVLVGLAVSPPTGQAASPTPAAAAMADFLATAGTAVITDAYIPDPDKVTIVPDAIPMPAVVVAIPMPAGLYSYSAEDAGHFATAAAAITPDLWGLRPGNRDPSGMSDTDRAAILDALAHGRPPSNPWLLESRRVLVAWSDALPDRPADLFSINCRILGDRVAAGMSFRDLFDRHGWWIHASARDLYEIAYNTGHSRGPRLIAVSRHQDRIREDYDADLRRKGKDPGKWDAAKRRLDWIENHDWRLRVTYRQALDRLDGR